MQILNLSATLNVVSLTPSINTYRLGEGVGTYNYNELNNKPSINNVSLQGNIQSSALGIKTSDLTNDSGYISDADIPTATSDLTNDSGFVNATQVQTVVSNAIPSDISYFTNDVGYITDADIGNIPTRTSQLINDSGYITSAEAPVTSVNNLTGAVALDGTNIEYEQNVSINAKIAAVEDSIPTATSDLTNDSGFITNANIPTRTSQLVNDSGFVNAQNIPVQSVNGMIGDVILEADNIPYDGSVTAADKITEMVEDIESIQTVIIGTPETGDITAGTDCTIRAASLKKTGHIIVLTAYINFATPITSRKTIANISATFRPSQSTTFLTGGSNAINSLQNRITNGIITASGDIVVGDIIVPAGESVKEVMITTTYYVD